MKKILVMMVAALFCAQVYGQTTVNGGYLRSSYSYSYAGYDLGFNGNGAYVGVSTDVKLNGFYDLTVAPGVYVDYVSFEFIEDANINVFYLRTPIHLKYDYVLPNGMNVFVSAGPSLAYALSGKTNVRYDGMSYSENFFEDGDNRFDVSLGAEGGISLTRNLGLVLGYDFGLIKQLDSEYGFNRNTFHTGIRFAF